jgi:membrane protease YdiL (CAAX protease family)
MTAAATRRSALIPLWILVAVVSAFSELACHVAFGVVPDWLLWLRIATLVIVLAIGRVSSRARPLRAFCAAYLFQLVVVALLRSARLSSAYQSVVAERGFVGSQLFLQSVWITAWVPAIVWMRRHRDRFYLRLGNLGAKVDLTKTRVSSTPLRWSSLGPLCAIVSVLCAWIFVRETGSSAPAASSLVPWAVLFSAINAFGEEVVNRNLLVGALKTDFSPAQAVLVSAAIFGVEHWRGLPGGLVGFLMTFALAFVAGRAMVDTKGTFWSWLMHAAPDCVLFYMWGIGSVGHG